MSPLPEEIIKKQVIEQLTWDDSVNANDVHVDITDGTAILQGTVPNYTAKLAAERDAYYIEGITQVDNQLIIKFPPTLAIPSDKEIEGSIKNSLLWDSNLLASEIEVRVSKGVVTLTGTAYSYWEKHHAADIANKTRGVLEVNNKLHVKVANEYIDHEIEEDIRSALKRNVLIDESKIDISVHQGVAHLSGTAPNRIISQEARNVALYTQGVLDVINSIRIE